ncbi:uncharacterized protein LOC105194447 [Solenopsis invicta]|uniref:uncharacterized protein LOC105194447 n=1 Tax=Solenopsis invicta TaxID=13686 RepID=UPI0005961991|nr:uncharacterized protein LOC105194447 [Solenopsis invicta]
MVLGAVWVFINTVLHRLYSTSLTQCCTVRRKKKSTEEETNTIGNGDKNEEKKDKTDIIEDITVSKMIIKIQIVSENSQSNQEMNESSKSQQENLDSTYKILTVSEALFKKCADDISQKVVKAIAESTRLQQSTDSTKYNDLPSKICTEKVQDKNPSTKRNEQSFAKLRKRIAECMCCI